VQQLVCQGCGYPLRPLADGYVIDLSGDRLDALRPELWGTPRLDGRYWCPPDHYALNPAGHVPVPTSPSGSETSLVSNCQLSAEQWRVISYLYHPDQLSRRTSPSLADVIAKQAVDREDVIEVVERGLVQGRVGGEECTRGPLKRLPEKAIRLRMTKAGIYRASHDPQHLVLCALRGYGYSLYLDFLMHRLAEKVTFGQLCEIADKGLITAHLLGDDIEVPIRSMHDNPRGAVACLTGRGKTFVAYQ